MKKIFEIDIYGMDLSEEKVSLMLKAAINYHKAFSEYASSSVKVREVKNQDPSNPGMIGGLSKSLNTCNY